MSHRSLAWIRVAATLLTLASCRSRHEAALETSATSSARVPEPAPQPPTTTSAARSAAKPLEESPSEDVHGCGGLRVLVGHDAEGVPRRAYVPATRNGKRIAMELDTGSATSFVAFDLKAEPSVEHTKESVQLGSGTRTLPGRRISLDPDAYGAKEREQLTIEGVLGAEEILGGTTDLDLVAGCLTKYPHGQAIPGTASWVRVPFSVVNGVIVTTVQIDGERHRALFDTGVGYSILVTEKVDPYVNHQVVHDVRGLRVDLYDRRGAVRWGSGEPESVWVERTKTFHTFDDMKLGDVRTMVGISAMGARRIIVDRDNSVLLLEPHQRKPAKEPAREGARP